MEKIELTVADIHAASHPSEAFSLILKEKEGERYVPVIIGMSEARAILVEINKSPTHRPLTHELFVSLADSFECKMQEVNIIYYKNGVYYADILMKQHDGTVLHIDARPSDAIALALKYNAPFFMSADIFEENHVQPATPDDEALAKELVPEFFELSDFLSEDEELVTEEYISQKLKEMSMNELQSLLDGAVENEDFELAEKIQKEINRRQ